MNLKSKVTSSLDKIINNAGLGCEKILKIYTLILFASPLLFAIMLELKMAMSKVSFQNALHTEPAINIAIIIALSDFILSYVMFMEKDNLIKDRTAYRYVFKSQAITQLLVGNFVCCILAVVGIYKSNEIDDGKTTSRSKVLTTSTICSGLLALSAILLLVISL